MLCVKVAPEHEVPPYASRRTATGLVEPHVSLRMDRSNLGLEEFYASRSRASSRTYVSRPTPTWAKQKN